MPSLMSNTVTKMNIKKIALLTLLFLLGPALASGALYTIKPAVLEKSDTFYKVEVEYPVLSGLSQEFDAAFNAQSKKHAEMMAEDFICRATQANQDSPSAPGTKEQYLSMGFEAKNLSDRLLALLFTGEEYTGGAHPQPLSYALLFNPKTGQKLSTQDLFKKDIDGAALLAKYTRADLLTRAEQLLSDETWIMKGTDPEAESFTVVWPEDDGLHVLFQDTQVAPHATGPVESTVPYSKLIGKLNTAYFDNEPAPGE